MADRCVPIKQERPDLGGTESDTFDTPLDPNEDGLEMREVFLQKDTGRDSNVSVTRDNSDNLVFKDPNAGTKTLSALSASGTSRNDFLLDNEPVEVGITYTPTYTSGRITNEEWKNTNNRKYKTIDYTYSSGRISTEVRKVYDPADGTTVLAQVTITYSYSGATVSSYVLVRNV